MSDLIANRRSPKKKEKKKEICRDATEWRNYRDIDQQESAMSIYNYRGWWTSGWAGENDSPLETTEEKK